MSLAQVIATLRAAWLRIAMMVIVAVGVAAVVVADEPKQYTAKARVMLNIQNTDPSRYSVAKKGIAGGYIGTEMRLMVDDAVTRQVVTALGWPDNPQVVAAWQASTGGAGDVTTWAAHRIGASIAPRQLEDSSIIEINYSSSTLDAAKEIVALIRTAYIDQSQRLRVEAARRASAWNRTEAANALKVVQTAEAARAAFVTANGIAVDSPEGGLEYQAQVYALRSSLATDDTSTGANTRFNASADRLAQRLDALDAQIAVQRLRGEANPATVMLQAQRAATAQELAREKAVAAGGAGVTGGTIGLVRAQRDAEYLKARLAVIQSAPLYDRLAQLNRDVKLKTARYQAATERVANFDSVAATPSGVRVIGDVIASPDPSYPIIPLIIGIAAGTSFALAVTFALIAELTRQQVRGVADLTATVAAPVLAVIADAPAGRRWSRWRRLFTRRAPVLAAG
jgi:succinoglycan biosynthesis transport protein ExoP